MKLEHLPGRGGSQRLGLGGYIYFWGRMGSSGSWSDRVWGAHSTTLWLPWTMPCLSCCSTLKLWAKIKPSSLKWLRSGSLSTMARKATDKAFFDYGGYEHLCRSFCVCFWPKTSSGWLPATYGNLRFSFWRAAKLCPQQLHCFAFPEAHKFWLPHILASAPYFYPIPFTSSHPSGYHMVLLICISLTNDVENLFVVLETGSR